MEDRPLHPHRVRHPGLAYGIGNQEIADVRAFLSDRTGGGITR